MLAIEQDVLEPEECLLLLQVLGQKRIFRPVYEHHVFDLNRVGNQCKRFFRFNQPELELLAQKLQFPCGMHTPSSDHATGTEVMCILLARMAVASNWNAHCDLFGRSVPVLSRLFKLGIIFMYKRWSHLLMKLPLHYLIPRIEEYAEKINDAGCPYNSIFGFIDGTFRAIAKPTEEQRCLYRYEWKSNFNSHILVVIKSYMGFISKGLFFQMGL